MAWISIVPANMYWKLPETAGRDSTLFDSAATVLTSWIPLLEAYHRDQMANPFREGRKGCRRAIMLSDANSARGRAVIAYLADRKSSRFPPPAVDPATQLDYAQIVLETIPFIHLTQMSAKYFNFWHEEASAIESLFHGGHRHSPGLHGGPTRVGLGGRVGRFRRALQDCGSNERAPLLEYWVARNVRSSVPTGLPQIVTVALARPWRP